jgi:hypothetical protein
LKNMMKSKNSYELLDLNLGLPTTQEDILALRRARKAKSLSFAAYLKFLANFAPPSATVLRARSGPAGIKPFEL